MLISYLHLKYFLKFFKKILAKQIKIYKCQQQTYKKLEQCLIIQVRDFRLGKFLQEDIGMGNFSES